MIKIEYGDFESENIIVPSVGYSFCSPISNFEDIFEKDLEFKNYLNPCENYSVLLDGFSEPIPSNTEYENMGIWSQYASDDKGKFKYNPVVYILLDQHIGSSGLTFEFDTINNIYPTFCKITWGIDDAPVKFGEYEINSPYFTLLEDVRDFDEIRIEFSKMNYPYSRLKFRKIEYSPILEIPGSSIKNIKLHQIVNPLSNSIPVSELSLAFLDSSNATFDFSANQSLNITENNNFVGKFFIENAVRVNKKQWNITAKDYISLLDTADFVGGLYVNELAVNIITNILEIANIPFNIEDGLKEKRVSGLIPYTTCRKALQQVLFAIGAYANTAYSKEVNIKEMNTEIKETIGLDRIFIGQNISTEPDVTEVELYAHSYIETENEIILYESDKKEDNVKVIFNEPSYNLQISNGTIVEYGTNYAIINANADCVLKGKRYEHLTFSKKKVNNTTKNTKSTNKKIIKNATLVSSSNIDNILNVCYNYIVRNQSIKSRVEERETPLVVGYFYEVDTELLGKKTGFLVEQNFSLYGGNKVVKETVIK